MPKVRLGPATWSLFGRKNTNKIHCCIDFRNVNLLTRNRNCWPIRNIEVSFTKFQKAKFISSLDLVNAYWTLRMDRESAPITGFFGVNGEHLQWLRMPFGLSASPSSYNQVMAQVLQRHIRLLFPLLR